MPRDPEPTRRRLVEAGERLFAEQGIAGVSLREINQLAGQKNSSALQYHFRSREGLLRAVLQQHTSAVRDARLAVLKDVTEDGAPDLWAAARVLVEPVAAPLEWGPSGRAFCRIVAHVLTDPSLAPEDLAGIIGDTAREYAYELLQPYLDWLPDWVLAERLFVSQLQLTHAIAARAQIMNSPTQRQPATTHEFFVANLTDMFVGAIAAPVSAKSSETAGIAEEQT